MTTLKKTEKLVFKTNYCLMQVKSIADSAILLALIKLPFVFKIFVLSIFERLFYTDFTVELKETVSISFTRQQTHMYRYITIFLQRKYRLANPKKVDHKIKK